MLLREDRGVHSLQQYAVAGTYELQPHLCAFLATLGACVRCDGSKTSRALRDARGITSRVDSAGRRRSCDGRIAGYRRGGALPSH